MHRSIRAAIVVLSIAAVSALGLPAALGDIVPSSQFRYVSTDVQINDSEDNGTASDFQDAPDFSPFSASLNTVANAGVESGLAQSNQESEMDILEIHATGEVFGQIETISFVEGESFAETSFEIAFSVDVAGFYNFDAAVLAGGVNTFTSNSAVEFKDSIGTIAFIDVSGNNNQSIPTTLVELLPGQYSITAYSTILVTKETPLASSAEGSFEVNLVYVSPEPASLALVAAGLLLMARRRRSR